MNLAPRDNKEAASRIMVHVLDAVVQDSSESVVLTQMLFR